MIESFSRFVLGILLGSFGLFAQCEEMTNTGSQALASNVETSSGVMRRAAQAPTTAEQVARRLKVVGLSLDRTEDDLRKAHAVCAEAAQLLQEGRTVQENARAALAAGEVDKANDLLFEAVEQQTLARSIRCSNGAPGNQTHLNFLGRMKAADSVLNETRGLAGERYAQAPKIEKATELLREADRLRAEGKYARASLKLRESMRMIQPTLYKLRGEKEQAECERNEPPSGRSDVVFGTSFSEVRSIDHLPEEIGKLLGRDKKPIANRCAMFNRTDVVLVDGLPWRRFGLAAVSANRIYAAIEHGGMGYSVELWAFEPDGKGGWRSEELQPTSSPPTSVQGLVNLANDAPRNTRSAFQPIPEPRSILPLK